MRNSSSVALNQLKNSPPMSFLVAFSFFLSLASLSYSCLWIYLSDELRGGWICVEGGSKQRKQPAMKERIFFSSWRWRERMKFKTVPKVITICNEFHFAFLIECVYALLLLSLVCLKSSSRVDTYERGEEIFIFIFEKHKACTSVNAIEWNKWARDRVERKLKWSKAFSSTWNCIH